MPIDLLPYGLSVVAAGGGGGAIAYGVFKVFGAKWLDNRFARQLEKAKQDHATEMSVVRRYERR